MAGPRPPRGETVPHLARYCLMPFGESMGIGFPVSHPAVCSAAKVSRLKPTKSAPGVPFGFLEKLEAISADDGQPQGRQLAAALFCLMTFASLRFAEIRDVSHLRITHTAICGRPLNHKDKNGAIMAWAAPKEGLRSDGEVVLADVSILGGGAVPGGDRPEHCESTFRFLPLTLRSTGHWA